MAGAEIVYQNPFRLMPSPLAAVTADNAWKIIVACGLLMAAVIVLFLAVWYYRKRVLQSDESSSAALWTFEDLRRMRDRGDLTDEEYQSLRAAMIGAYQGTGERDRATKAVGAGPLAGDETLLTRDFDVQKGPEA